MWKKTLFSLLSLLSSLLGFYGAVRMGWTWEILVMAGLVTSFLILGLFSGNEKAKKPVVRPVVRAAEPSPASLAEGLPMMLDEPVEMEPAVEEVVESPIRPARTFEWGALPPVGTVGPSQF